MTLYDLTNSTTVQGNIEIKVFDSQGSEKESRFFRDQDDFSCYMNDCDDMEDFRINYIYPTKGCDGTVWLVIELCDE